MKVGSKRRAGFSLVAIIFQPPNSFLATDGAPMDTDKSNQLLVSISNDPTSFYTIGVHPCLIGGKTLRYLHVGSVRRSASPRIATDEAPMDTDKSNPCLLSIPNDP